MKRLWMKKALSLSLALLMLLSLVACGGNDKVDNDAGKTNTSDKADSGKTESADKGTSSEPELKERVVIGMSGIMENRDPHATTVTVNSFAYRLTHNTLIEWNSETKVFDPELAESWEMNEDGTVVTFKLREDVTSRTVSTSPPLTLSIPLTAPWKALPS